MKNFITLAFILLNISCFSQDSIWKLPIKNNYIYYSFDESINSPKHDLCHYYDASMFNFDFSTKLNQIMANKSKENSNIFKSSDYQIGTMTKTGVLGKGFETCNVPGQNDTFNGIMTYTTSKVGLLSGNNTLMNIKFKIVFIGNNEYHLTIMGFTVMDFGKGGQKDLEEVYNEFLTSGKKDKKKVQFFQDLNSIMYSFNDAMYQTLKKAVDFDNM